MRQYGPMKMSEAIRASGLTMAVGWIMGDFGFRIWDFGLWGPELAHSGAANPKSEIRNPKSSSRLLTNRGKQDRFGRKLGTDPYLTFHFPDARLAADDL